MKRYLIVADHPNSKPVSSHALNRAKQYAMQMAEDVPEGTPIHIFIHHSQVIKSVVWSNNITKAKANGVAKKPAMLVRMLEAGEPVNKIAQTLQRTPKGVRIRIDRMRAANKSEAQDG
jgi:predicted transcriptional regulator